MINKQGDIEKYIGILGLFSEHLQSLQAIDTLCSLMIKYDKNRINRGFRALQKLPFFEKFLNKVLLILSTITADMVPTIKNMVHLICRHSNQLSIDKEDHPLNNPNIYEFAYHYDIMCNKRLEVDKVRSFARIGRVHRD